MNFRERLGAFFGGEEPKPELKKDESLERKDNISYIEKPTDEELLAKLERKLEEYKARTDDPDASYKIAVLETLLSGGLVDFNTLEAELFSKNKENFDSRKYYDAFMIIRSYVTGNLSKVHGGTGLK
jgi:Zn-dependent M16 (insulinase) family peptidase